MNMRWRCKTVLLGLSSALLLDAQAWEGTFRITAGQHGGAFSRAVNANRTFGGEFELARRQGPGQLAMALGYSILPGDQSVVSAYGKTLPATGTNPSFFDARLRLLEGQSAYFSALYRVEALAEGVYVQAGLRLGMNRSIQKDAGTRLVTTGLAIPDTNSTKDPNILEVRTIASISDTRTFSPGLLMGIGVRIGKDYCLEANASSHVFKTPERRMSGFAWEGTLGIRF